MSETLLGKQLDEYRIEKPLGEGGMASVYRALDVKLQRYAALKVIASDFRGDQDYISRFEREAQSIARLDHPHIARIYRFGESHGIYYLAMQFIEGADVGWLIRNYKAKGEVMPVADIVRVVEHIGAALDYAHGKGVIHRDVKPANIMVDEDGRAFLTDFGLALIEDVGTQGEIFGSPHYIAPEQVVNSSNVVPQSDLYALGATVFEMLTGEVPFPGEDPMEVALRHVSEAPPKPSQYNKLISPEIDALIGKMLAKEPGQRIQTGAEFARQLKAAVARWQLPAVAPADFSARRPSLLNVPSQVHERLQDADVALPPLPPPPPSSYTPPPMPAVNPPVSVEPPANIPEPPQVLENTLPGAAVRGAQSYPSEQPAYTPPPAAYQPPPSYNPPAEPVYTPPEPVSEMSQRTGMAYVPPPAAPAPRYPWLQGALTAGVVFIVGIVLLTMLASMIGRNVGRTEPTSIANEGATNTRTGFGLATRTPFGTGVSVTSTSPTLLPTTIGQPSPIPPSATAVIIIPTLVTPVYIPPPTLAPTLTPRPTREPRPTRTPVDPAFSDYQLMLAKPSRNLLYVVNVGQSTIPLSPLRLGNGGQAVRSGQWPVDVLAPNQCVVLLRERENMPDGQTVTTCEQVGGVTVVDRNRRIWDNSFTVFYNDRELDECDDEICSYSIPQG